MKATGIVRRIDDLGRIVIPKEIRNRLHIHEGDPLELYLDHESIVLKRYDFCGNYADRVKVLKDIISDDYDIPNKANILNALNNLLIELEGRH